MSPRRDPRLEALVRLAENLAIKLPIARAHIRRELATTGDLKAATYDGTRTNGRTINIDGDPIPITTVEHAALQRTHLTGKLDDLEADTKGIAMILARILQDCDRIIGTTIEVPRCTGGKGRDGAIEWGRPHCTNIASRGGDKRTNTPAVLCDTCSRYEYTWRKDHGLPPRADGVYSGEAKTA